MRKIFFDPGAHKQFLDWEKKNKKVFDKIVELIDDARRNPFEGKGKPEPLKHQFKGCWSRRITKEHRLVYKVTGESIFIIACRFHY